MIDKINWEKNPLVAVVSQDCNSKEILMLAWMNKEAYDLTLSTGFAHYFSRSKQRIWKKGESSGHTQKVVDILLDCDQDAILLKVEQNGVPCHTGRESCFFTSVSKNEEILNPKVDIKSVYSITDRLYHTILDRKNQDPDSSYVAKLFHKGENAILKKVVEEAGELCFAVKDKNRDEIIYEAADLTFHTLVALASQDVSPDLINQELERREGLSGIVEKKQRKN